MGAAFIQTNQKCICTQTSVDCLQVFKKNPADFLWCFVTINETWIHRHIPETKHSKQWTAIVGRISSEKSILLEKKLSAGKVMSSIFWVAKRILLIDYLKKEKTITGEYYASLLNRLRARIVEKRLGIAKKKVLFHHDNAPTHSSRLVQQKLTKLQFKLLLHPAYSHD